MRRLLIEVVALSVALSSLLSFLAIAFVYMYLSPPLAIPFSLLTQPSSALATCVRYGAGLNPVVGVVSPEFFENFVSSISPTTVVKVGRCLGIAIRRYLADFLVLRLLPISMLLASVAQFVVLRIFRPGGLAQVAIALGSLRFGLCYVLSSITSSLVVTLVSLGPVLVAPLAMDRLAIVATYFCAIYIPLALELSVAMATGSDALSIILAVMLFVAMIVNPVVFALALDPMLVSATNAMESRALSLPRLALGASVALILSMITLVSSYRGVAR